MVHGAKGSTWRRALGEAGVLILITMVLAAASWLLRTPRLPLGVDESVYEFELQAPLVEVSAALEFYEAGSHLFIDIRENGITGYIPGAFAIRGVTFDGDLREVIDFLSATDPLIIYGDGDLQSASAVAARFLERGYENLWILGGGYPGWLAAGGDSEEGELP